jgi:hypothetical protein
MRIVGNVAPLLVSLSMTTPVLQTIWASEPNCTQNRVDGSNPPATTYYIYPAQPVVPFYQWENNNGYCGEVSLMQAGMAHGQWMSQFNARLICGTGLSQSGPDGWCSAHKNVPHYNAQVLIEDPNTGVSGPLTYADAAACIANSRLVGTTYPYTTGYGKPNVGLSGYQDYMSWVKKELIAGHQVTVATLWKFGTDPQYDHEVTVVKIGTNHSPSDPSYYPDDVLYIDDHGLYTVVAKRLSNNDPPIPLGAGSDTTGCTPYVFGYTFASLAQTRKGASASTGQAYSIIIPGVYPTYTYAGEDGYKGTIAITGHNYAFSISGAVDNSTGGPHLLPVQISIPSATYTNGVANPLDSIAGWQYENSMIGTSLTGLSCTNAPPQYWMNPMALKATISGLTPGQAYNLYEYDLGGVTGTGSGAALSIPTQDFNKNASMATNVWQFVANSTTFTKTVTKTSNQIVVFRAVPASAP